MKAKKVIPKPKAKSTSKQIRLIKMKNKLKIKTKTNKTEIKTMNNKKKNSIKNVKICIKKSKRKQNKWQFGIISKTKANKLNTNKSKDFRRKKKSTKNLIEKGIITRSIARRLIDKNIMDSDKNFVIKQKTSHILNDDVLRLIFQYLSLKDRFRIQRTSKQFYAVVQDLLAEQFALRIGSIDETYGSCQDSRHSTQNADIESAIQRKYFYKYYYMNDITISKESLAQILWKCPNVRCIELHNFHIDVETVKWIKWHSPNIQCLRLDEIKYDLTARKWSQIGQSLGDKLVHLCIDAHSIKNDLTNLVQHLPLLEELQLKKYELPVNLLLKRLSSNITSLSIIECEKLNVDSIKVLANNRQIAKSLLKLELNVSTGSTVSDNKEIFSTICANFSRLQSFSFQSRYCPPNINELISLKELKSLELLFSLDCFLDLSAIECYVLTNVRSVRIHGAFFTPRMLELIGQQVPNCEHLKLTNWAFCCGCDDNQLADDYDCPDCDDKCCQSVLKLLNLQSLHIEFLFSSSYIKALILSLLSFRRLNTITLVWYPVNTSINSINFIDAIVNYGVSMANKNKNQLIRFQFERTVIGLIDAAKPLPRNLIIKAID